MLQGTRLSPQALVVVTRIQLRSTPICLPVLSYERDCRKDLDIASIMVVQLYIHIVMPGSDSDLEVF